MHGERAHTFHRDERLSALSSEGHRTSGRNGKKDSGGRGERQNGIVIGGAIFVRSSRALHALCALERPGRADAFPAGHQGPRLVAQTS